MIGDEALRCAARREEDRAALEAWEQRRRERLAREPEAVREEMLSEARARQERHGCIVWGARDSEICRIRVVSRERLKRYGAIPDGDEWKRQVAEIRAALGLAP